MHVCIFISLKKIQVGCSLKRDDNDWNTNYDRENFNFLWSKNQFLFSPLPFASLLSLALCKASSHNHFAFLHLFFFGMVLITASCTVLQPLSIVLQAICLPDLIPWIYSSPPVYNHRRFDLEQIKQQKRAVKRMKR